MKLDFTVHEESLKQDIGAYLNIYKNNFNKEKILLKQIKDNLELFDFLHLQNDANNISDTLETTWAVTYESISKYRDFLRKYYNSLNTTLSGMTSSSQKTKDAIYLKNVCAEIEEKCSLLSSAQQQNIISLIMLYKDIGKLAAIKEYTRDFPFTKEITKMVFKLVQQKVQKYTKRIVICASVLIFMSLLANVYGGGILCILLFIISVLTIVATIIIANV